METAKRPSISESGLILPNAGLTPVDLLRIMQVAGEPEKDEAVLVSDAIAALVAEELLRMEITRPDLVPLLTGMIIRRMKNPDKHETLVEIQQKMLRTRQWLVKMETAFELGERGVDCASGWNGKLMRIMDEEGAIRYGIDMAGQGYSEALNIAGTKPRHESAARIKILAERILDNIGEIVSVLLAIRKRQNRNLGFVMEGMPLVLA